MDEKSVSVELTDAYYRGKKKPTHVKAILVLSFFSVSLRVHSVSSDYNSK